MNKKVEDKQLFLYHSWILKWKEQLIFGAILEEEQKRDERKGWSVMHVAVK